MQVWVPILEEDPFHTDRYIFLNGIFFCFDFNVILIRGRMFRKPWKSRWYYFHTFLDLFLLNSSSWRLLDCIACHDIFLTQYFFQELFSVNSQHVFFSSGLFCRFSCSVLIRDLLLLGSLILGALINRESDVVFLGLVQGFRGQLNGLLVLAVLKLQGQGIAGKIGLDRLTLRPAFLTHLQVIPAIVDLGQD